MQKLVFYCLFLLWAGDTPPAPPSISDIQVPILEPTPVTPSPQPQPEPLSPVTPKIVQLSPDVFYIVRSDKPFIVVGSTIAGTVKITYEEGPIRIRGRFVENPTKIETREYKSKYIASVEGEKNGVCELLIWPAATTDPASIIRRKLDIVQMPQPPPNPDDPVPPVPSGDFRVLFISESKNLSPAKANVISAKSVLDYLDTHCVKPAGSKVGDYRSYDKDDSADKDTAIWQEIWRGVRPTDPAALQKWQATLPVVVVFNGTKGTSYPWPDTAAELLTILKKHGGQ